MDIRGKVVFITGASEGIGLETARGFARAGARVAVVARSADKLRALADELSGQGAETVAIPADVCDEDQLRGAIRQAVERLGGIDILINNAGQAAAGTVEDMSLDDFRRITELNVYGPIIAMQEAIPVMREHGGGLIINVSSMVSKMRIPALSAYAATKVALNMISDTARVELAEDNIRVISIFPRMTSTRFRENSLGNMELRSRQRTSTSAPVDTPEHVAERILSAAISEPEEQYMTE